MVGVEQQGYALTGEAEKEAILAIKNGKKLSEFEKDSISELMKIAAATYQENAFDDIKDDMWTRRLARMAIRKDFKYIENIPEEIKPYCSPEFVFAGKRLTRENVFLYEELLNKQTNSFISNCVKKDPSISRFVHKDKGSIDAAQQIVASRTDKKPAPKQDPFFPIVEEAMLDFVSAEMADEEELDPETFLALPVEKQKESLLNELIEQEDFDLPADFIKRLQMPNRNEAYYKKNGDEKQAKFWANRKIPYLNKELCLRIARIHPEASVKTPGYLDAESVHSFWEKKRENETKEQMTKYFMSFPETMLTYDMTDDINVTWETLRHAPSVFISTDEGIPRLTNKARLYLNRHPADILRLQEEYQEERRVIADGVNLYKGTISLIKNEELKEKVALAFNIDI